MKFSMKDSKVVMLQRKDLNIKKSDIAIENFDYTANKSSQYMEN